MFEYETLQEAFQSNMKKGSSVITSQTIGLEFASRLASDEPQQVQYLDQLCDILGSLERDIRAFRKERNQAFSFTLSSRVRCVFCNKATKLLVKCQHKNCTNYCHITCYLSAHRNQCFQHLQSSILYFCEEHEGDVALLNERTKSEVSEKTVNEEEATPGAFTPVATGTRLTARLTALRETIQRAYMKMVSSGEAGESSVGEVTA